MVNNENIDRKDELETFLNLLNKIKKDDFPKPDFGIKSYNICLNARWGNGKTTFLKQLIPEITKIKLYNEKNIINISAWEYDYLDNPIELIFDVLNNNDKLRNKINSISKNILAELQEYILYDPNRKILTKFLMMPIKAAIKYKKDYIPNILTFKKVISKINDIFQPEENKNKKPEENKNTKYEYLIIIEDLDRCRPDFAKKLFEIFKHLFNSELFAMIFVCDWHLINSMMSNNILINDYNELYLDRIIHFVFSLKKMDVSKYYFDKYLKEIDNDIQRITIENTNYLTYNIYFGGNYFHSALENCSLREQNLYYHKLEEMLKGLKKYSAEKFIMCPELYNFLLKNFLGNKEIKNENNKEIKNENNKEIKNENIFWKYFYEKERDFDEDKRCLILDSIFNILIIIYDNRYHKENNILFINEIIFSDIFENFDNEIINFGPHKKLEKVISHIFSLEDNVKKQNFKILFNHIKSDKILEIINNWFSYEINKY